MKTAQISVTVDNYATQYPHYSSSFNELEKLFWVFGQELKSLKYLHKLYVDSYSLLDKRSWLVANEETPYGTSSESGHRLGIYNLIQSFLPNKSVDTVHDIGFFWNLLFLTAVTPEGLRNFIKFLVADYIVRRNIDITYLNTVCNRGSSPERINELLPKINSFIYEWSTSEEVQVGGYYFFPGSLPFMSIHVLVGVSTDIFSRINSAELVKHIYNQLQDSRFSKLTPTLKIETLNIVEDWENG